MPEAVSILFVDDEDSIRLTLPLLLEREGFKVTSARNVPEALNLIATQEFQVLLTDLNIGYPGDGFAIVSAMRSTQPDALRFILTGYPAFESALEAMRHAQEELRAAVPEYHGHRAEAMKHLDAAIHEAEICMQEK